MVVAAAIVRSQVGTRSRRVGGDLYLGLGVRRKLCLVSIVQIYLILKFNLAKTPKIHHL